MCVFRCSRVKLPVFRAAVASTDHRWGLASSPRALGLRGERVVRLGAPPALRSLIWSRIRTELERFTCAAMLRMQTLVCFPVRCNFGFNFPGFALDV